MSILTKIRARHGRFSDHVRRGAVLVLALALGGCVVHDNNSAPEPSWWPTFMLRQETVAPSGGKVNVNVEPTSWPNDLRGPQATLGGGAMDVASLRAAYAGAPVWFDPGTFYNASSWYEPQPYSQINGGAQAPAPYPQLDTPSLYPGRGQATLESGNATLYPPRGVIVTTPQHDPTLYPRGAAGPSGYRGK